jgi:4-amino-4-deoxy-L-arabinose transferase-like glycosyltransferase
MEAALVHSPDRPLIRHAWLVVAAVAALPRLIVLLAERGDILTFFTEKSDDIATTFVRTGTFGFIPGQPSAWTQPLYALFLSPIYWTVGRSWVVVGLLQIALAVLTALLVYEIGRRVASPEVGLVGAVIATLSPYLIWHDVHVNREILDQPIAAAIVLLALLMLERPRVWVGVALGAVLGLAVLANARLLLLVPVLAILALWRRRWVTAVAIVGVCALVLAPWVIRNRVSVGCFAITTDAKALWKANNADTRRVLDETGGIDDVPTPAGFPPTPEQAFGTWRVHGTVIHVDECAQMRKYQHLVYTFWRQHPGEKALLALQAVKLLWDPRSSVTTSGPGAGGWLDTVRKWVQPLHTIPLFVLGLVGLFLLPRRVAFAFVGLLAYQTVLAMAFAGFTRYRVPWDFLIAIPAGAAVVEGARRLARARARPVSMLDT